jgi:hypothetical protein
MDLAFGHLLATASMRFNPKNALEEGSAKNFIRNSGKEPLRAG